MKQTHQLAAILFTDIVGSTAIMQKDEQAALSINKRYVAVLKQSVSAHGGEILNDYGDGSLCSFTSATQAVKCAIEMQEQFRLAPMVPLRVGLHIGEILFEDGKVLGDGVNVASRIQSLGVSNSILFSSEIHSKLANQPSLKCISLGKFQFKHVDAPMEVFALANEGLVVPDRKKMEGKLQEKGSKNKKIFLTVAALLLLFISFIVFRQYFNRPGFTGKDKSIAVLPLESLSQTKDSQWVNDGFTQAVIDKLSKLSGLTEVSAWARVRGLRIPPRTIKDIAEELGVSAILSWNIQKQPDKFRISTELIDVSTNKKMWFEEFDTKRKDILTLQTEVAEKIASSLAALVTPQDSINIKKQYTDNPEAWNYYLRGRYFWDTRTPAFYDSAKRYYDKAIALDPKYALAYAGLADLYTFNSFGLTQREAVPHARDLVNTALELDSTLVPAIASLGFIQGLDYDWKKALLTLQKAIRLDPKYTFAHVFYGNILILTREDIEGGIVQHKIALGLEPLSMQVNWVMGRTYFQVGKYDLAEAQLRKTLKLFPAYSQLPKVTLMWLLLIQKRYPEAFEFINQIPVNGKIVNIEYRGTLLAYAYASRGDTIRAKKELAKTIAENSFKLNYFLARDYVALKDYNKAFNYLDKANEERELLMAGLYTDTAMAPLRNYPRFKELLKKINLE